MADALAPRWELEINGGDLLARRYCALVTSLQVDSTLDGADEIRLEAVAWDSVSQEYRFLGEKILAPGNTVVPLVGYGRDLVALQRFTVVRHEAQYPESGPPTVSIFGYSAEYRLAQHTGPRVYEAPTSLGAIARDLAADHRLAVTVASVADGPALQGPRVKEAGTTDLEFLRSLCAEADFGAPQVRYDAATRQDVLYVRPARLDWQEEIARFVWRVGGLATGRSGTLFAFSPSLSLAGVSTRVEVLGWDDVAGEPIRVVAELGEGGQETTVFRGLEAGRLAQRHRSGSELLVRVLADGDDPRSEVREFAAVQHVRSVEGALAWAKRWLATRNRAWLTSRATTLGYERLWAGQFHRFEGLAVEHEGLWEVVGASHVLDEQGYRCELDLEYVLSDAAAPREGG